VKISKLISALLTKQRQFGDKDVLVALPEELSEGGGWGISRVSVAGSSRTTADSYEEDKGKVVLIVE
jgi:hypothetical protein